ncbi:MAG TPA: glycosyltransferase, partial [Casimicrobiaceae bacterium]|nr:glycosyltransferase [Casimicrobiaceae bacterium]
AALIYGDHDAISHRGDRYDPVLKPRFDAELLRHAPYIAGLCALRRERCVAMGALRAPDWLGVIDFALRLAEVEDPSLVASLREVLVHRLDVNLGELDRSDFRRRMNDVVLQSLRRTGVYAVRLSGTAGAPAMWGYSRGAAAPVSVYLRGHDSPRDAAACLEALMAATGARIAEVLVDLPENRAEELRAQLARRGSSIPLRSVALQGGGALAEALFLAKGAWIAVVEARCRAFTPGWLERLEQGLSGRFVAGIAPHLAVPDGSRSSGAQLLGGGPWSVAGPMPISWGTDNFASLYGAPREVSALSPYLSLWRREAVRMPGVIADLALAGRFDVVRLGMALRERGLVLLDRPFVAARLEIPPAPPRTSAAETDVPPDVAWMRANVGAALHDDPAFHPALSLTAARVSLAPRFAARREGLLRIAAFPFDRWGSGELRVRGPCMALERAGIADVAMMDTQDTGRAPNALEWKRLDPDTLLAHNFFHDFQLVALDEYGRAASALRVLGIDDLLTEIPAGNPYAATIYPDIAARIARAVERCDRLIVTSQALADAYGRGIETHVIPNALDERAWAGLANAKHDGARPRVGWAGARQHGDDLMLLEEIVAATAHEVDWVFLGMCPPALRRHAAQFHPMVPFAQYPAKLASLGLDVAVAPLQDNAFNRAKSDVKIAEYGMLGIPAVASAVAPYIDTPSILARTRDDWVDAIRSLTRDRDARQRYGAAAREWVLTQRTLIRMLELWRRVLSREGRRTPCI